MRGQAIVIDIVIRRRTAWALERLWTHCGVRWFHDKLHHHLYSWHDTRHFWYTSFRKVQMSTTWLYVHPPTAPYHQKKKEGSRREEKFSYATAPHAAAAAAAAAAAHHVALLHTIAAKCEFVQKKPLFLDIITHRFNRTKCQIFNLDLKFDFGFSQIAGLLQNI